MRQFFIVYFSEKLFLKSPSCTSVLTGCGLAERVDPVVLNRVEVRWVGGSCASLPCLCRGSVFA